MRSALEQLCPQQKRQFLLKNAFPFSQGPFSICKIPCSVPERDESSGFFNSTILPNIVLGGKISGLLLEAADIGDPGVPLLVGSSLGFAGISPRTNRLKSSSVKPRLVMNGKITL